MAAGCYGARRLSDLLQEHQEEEPFLEAPRHRSAVDACARRLRQLGCAVGKRQSVGVSATDGDAGGGTLLCCGYRTARKALRWGDLAGCFACGARQRFRRLPRAGDIVGDRCDVVSELDGGDGDCGRQLSPVSVLDLHSDEESPVLSNWDEEEDDDDGKPSSSPPSDHDDLNVAATPPCSAFFVTDGKIRAMEVEVQHNSKRNCGECTLLEKEHHQAMIVSDWERIAADISRIPALVALDLSGSAREWRRRLVGEEEARRVGQSIEAMIFEEVRWEAVRDMMLCFCSARVNSDRVDFLL